MMSGIGQVFTLLFNRLLYDYGVRERAGLIQKGSMGLTDNSAVYRNLKWHGVIKFQLRLL